LGSDIDRFRLCGRRRLDKRGNTEDNEVFQALFEQVQLMSTRMSPQQCIFGDVVSIAFSPGDVVGRDVEDFKVVDSRHDGVEIFEALSLLGCTLYRWVRDDLMRCLMMLRG
jgi:hypothetical protein